MLLATPYNVSVKDTSSALTNFRANGFASKYRRKNMFLCNASARRVRVAGGDQLSSVHEPVNMVRLGGLSEHGLSYKEKFVIRFYEVGMNKTATIQTIANLMKEVIGNHTQAVGFSADGYATTTTMKKMHLIWVCARMHIEVYKYPAWSDVIEIETWIQEDGRSGSRCDWILKDHANGEIIGRGTSKWVLMSEDTRKLQKVNDDVREELKVFGPKTLRLAFPEENHISMRKISKLEDPAEYSSLGLVVRRSDLDQNNHVNYVNYIGWALQSIPAEIINTHELQNITLDYRRECQQGDIVDSLTSREPLDDRAGSKLQSNKGSSAYKNDEQDLIQFLHLIRSSGNGLEINRCRTQWRKKPAKS